MKDCLAHFRCDERDMPLFEPERQPGSQDSVVWRFGGIEETGRFGAFVQALVVCFGLSGCGTPELPLERVGADDPALEPSSGLSLEHDFGVVSPNSENRHTFSVRNTSKGTWTLKRIHVTCVCTVVDASESSIKGGEAEEFEVLQRVGDRNEDEVRSVLLEFNEDGAPKIQLVVRARVRKPLTVSETALAFGSMGRGGEAEKHFEIVNFSSLEWQSLSVEPLAAWLRVDRQALGARGDGEHSPLQQWRCTVRAATEELPFGRHQAVIRVHPGAGEIDVVEVPVSLVLSAPFHVVPSEMFFGTVVAGEESQAKIELLFLPGSPQFDSQTVVVAHDMKEGIELELSEVAERHWRLEAKLTPREEGLLEGNISVSFGNEELPELNIPLLARVRRP